MGNKVEVDELSSVFPSFLSSVVDRSDPDFVETELDPEADLDFASRQIGPDDDDDGDEDVEELSDFFDGVDDFLGDDDPEL